MLELLIEWNVIKLVWTVGIMALGTIVVYLLTDVLVCMKSKRLRSVIEIVIMALMVTMIIYFIGNI